MSTLLTFGAFDATHAGHAAFLRSCERFADAVIAAVRSDEMVRKNKGALPIFSYPERAALIEALGYEVRESTEAGADLIDAIRPDVLAIGSDWSQADWLTRLGLDQATLDEWGIATIFIPYTPGISTTELKRRLCR